MRKKMLAVLLASLCAGNVWAEDKTIKIAPQAMPAALHSLASQTGIQLLFSAEELKGIQAKPLNGAMSAEDALARLLSGSGYTFQASGKGTYVIKAAPPPPPQKKVVAEEVQQLAEVVISATRTPNPLARVPASVSLVTQEDFEAVQAATVSQAMKKLPNVEFGGGPRVNGEIPTIRGVYGPSVTLLVDGARQNDTATFLRSPLYLDPYFLRQVEVLRGPASSLYGSGGNGGVMTFTTLSARDLLAPSQDFGGGAKVAYGQADKSSRINARLYGSNGVADGLISLGRHEWNKIKQGGGTYLDPNDGEASTGLIKLGVQPTSDRRIELSHQFYQSDNLQVNNPQATEYRTANLPITMPAIQMVHVDQANTVLKGTLGDADGTPALSATLYKSTLKVVNDRSPDPAITNVLYSHTKTDTDGASLQGTRVLDGNGWGRHRLTAGVDWFRDQQTAVSATAANPSAASSVTRNGTRQATGAFVQDEIVLGGGWSLTPSLRSDRYEANVADGSLPDNSASRASPKLAAAWQDGSGLMLYGNVGEAFRAPTIVELYQNFTGFGLTNFLPNADLRPEIDRTLEIGAKFGRKSILAGGDSLKLRAAWFDSRVTDLIYSTNLGGMTPVGSTAAQQAAYSTTCATTGMNCKLQYQNVADAQRSGGEIEAGYVLGAWQLNAAYSRVRVENRGNGDKLFSPPDKLTLQIRHQLHASNLAVFWNTTGVAAQDYDTTVLRRRPGYATHDLFASWTPFGQRFKLDAGISNLFDKRYAAYQSSNAYAYTFQEGRSVKLAISADF